MRHFFLALLVWMSAATGVYADNWQQVLERARGQTVYWNAWGGDERTNAFIGWVGQQTAEKYGVSVRHVKLSDTAEAVTRVLSEKAAGQFSDGSVDLIWINGPNFLAMKEQELLFGPFVADLSNARYLDLGSESANSNDFTVPVEGFESPWRLAKFVFAYDSARIKQPPESIRAFTDWAEENPGRFTHPDPSNFMGATFLKQALIELTNNPELLLEPVTDDAFAIASATLWDWYETLRINMWRQGEILPENESQLHQLMNDGEIDITMSFDPAFAAGAIAQGLLPETTRVFVPEGGTIGNVSFVGIPFNAANREGAMVIANFLLEPSTQAHMQNIEVLGSFSVLDHERLDEQGRAAFSNLPTAPALPTLQELGPTLPEPHPSWMTQLSAEWAKRYTR